MADKKTPAPKPAPRPAPPRETIERGYQPNTGKAPPSNPPNRGSGGKK